MNDPRIIVALDFPDSMSALNLVARLDPSLCRLKVGKELFTAAGPQLVETMMGKGFEIFLDLKFHDIPTTVANACRTAAALGVWMMNVHALGGRRMLAAAREAVGDEIFDNGLIARNCVINLLHASVHPDVENCHVSGEFLSGVGLQ